MDEKRAASAAGPQSRILGPCDIPLWGLTATERWHRWCSRAGIASRSEAEPVAGSGTVILLRADTILDEGLAQPLRDKCPVLVAIEHPVRPNSGERVVLAAHVPA